MYRRTIAVALLIASLSFAPAPVFRERPNTKDMLQRLQGTWDLNVADGPNSRRSTLVRIKGDTWTYVFVTNGVESEGSPSKIILGIERGLTTLDLELRQPGPGVTPHVLRGLVKVEGKLLWVCYSGGCYSPSVNDARPSAFAVPWRDGEPVEKYATSLTVTFRKLK